MSVLLGKNTRVIVQGLGREGRFHAERMTCRNIRGRAHDGAQKADDHTEG